MSRHNQEDKQVVGLVAPSTDDRIRHHHSASCCVSPSSLWMRRRLTNAEDSARQQRTAPLLTLTRSAGTISSMFLAVKLSDMLTGESDIDYNGNLFVYASGLC